MGKVAYIISCSDHYNVRLHVFDKYLKDNGYSVNYITSDFDHNSKEFFTCSVNGSIQIHAKPYKKNISFARIFSHKFFAKAVYKYLLKLENKPDVIVMHIPPNFLAHYAAKFKKKYPKTKLIFDIFDLWPETFPSNKQKKLLAPAFKVWGSLRDRSFKYADFIISECDLFREKLKLKDDLSGTLYLCGKELKLDSSVKIDESKIELCYVGAINNLISISSICKLISGLVKEKQVILHVIGKGEKTEKLLNSVKSTGAEVVYYGPIYDDEKKNEIIRRCMFGLNIMKDAVCVGLTMKSIEYFRYGLPIINNIPADTRNMVLNEGVGVELDGDCVQKILKMNVSDCVAMRGNVKNLFKNKFTEEDIYNKLDLFIGEMVK